MLALAACGENASRQAVQATAQIGADGGSISLGAISVAVPAGTLGAETTLSVRFAADHPDGNIGPAYQIDAAGAALLAPVTIQYKVDNADLPDGTALADVRLAFAADGAWQALPDCEVDAETSVVRCQTTHFSIWGAVPPLPPIPCSTAADCPEMECMVANCDGGGCAYTADPACPCTPDCTGKECGDDGCGGTCGECDILDDHKVCSEDGQCVCAYLECGDTCCGDKESCLAPDGEGEPSGPQCVACEQQCTVGEKGCTGTGTRWECIQGPGGCPVLTEWECAPDTSCVDGECVACGDDCCTNVGYFSDWKNPDDTCWDPPQNYCSDGASGAETVACTNDLSLCCVYGDTCVPCGWTTDCEFCPVEGGEEGEYQYCGSPDMACSNAPAPVWAYESPECPPPHADQDTPICLDETVCPPNCAGKECGSDGCGGSCGECKQYYTCQAGSCGPEQGGPFWPCEDNSDCSSGWCIETDQGNLCTMNCIEECPNDWVCEPEPGPADTDLVYICLPPTCLPGCAGKECGDDGCGGSCGECEPVLSCVAGACVAGQACDVWDYITPEELDGVGECCMDLWGGVWSEPVFPALYGEGHLFKEDLALDGEFFLVETAADQTAITLTAPCVVTGLEIVVWSDNDGLSSLVAGGHYPLANPACLSNGSCDCEICIFAQASLEGKPTLNAIAGTVMLGCGPKNCDCGVMSYSLRLADLTFADIAGEKQFINVHSDGPDWLPMDEWLQTVSAE